MEPINVKILGNKRHQRYIIWRAVQSAETILKKDFPGIELQIQNVTTIDEIQKYTPVFAFPSLMIAEELVCVGRYPSRDEVLGWLRTVIN